MPKNNRKLNSPRNYSGKLEEPRNKKKLEALKEELERERAEKE